ncbi:hypothetical protein MTR67_017993 [Solanum verrucosum]|uniref:Gag-pol polyprotein n=1 Tax=Solanum verrucosum TaxID=315347 RepID=A0AAF0TSW8_SOLVR|nr:hypothetical protein MTR67_017993 [Solanum verrucosum]
MAMKMTKVRIADWVGGQNRFYALTGRQDSEASPDVVKELIMLDFDVIMGMDWLIACYANIDCRAKIVRFYLPGEPVLQWKGNAVTPKVESGACRPLANCIANSQTLKDIC